MTTTTPTVTELDEFLARLLNEMPRGSGPYGTFVPGDARPSAELVHRANAVRQALRWRAAADQAVAAGRPSAVKLERAMHWYRRALGRRVAKKHLRRFPALRWDDPS